MKKHWKKIYLCYSTLVFAIIILVCSLGFYSNNVSSVVEKHEFENIYLDTEIDFIAPSPSLEQVESLENDDNGIEQVTPYYAFNTELSVNKELKKSNVILLDDLNKIGFTPYNKQRIIVGTVPTKNYTAVIDKSYSDKNKCSLNDDISFELENKEYNFKVVAITENNTSYKGSIALIISKEDSKNIYSGNFKYSAAYLKSDDYAKSKSYLSNDYKPLGRLKDKESFANEEAYNRHVTNFNNADWSQEITDMTENYSELNIKYYNVLGNAIKKTIVSSVIYFIIIVAFNLAVLLLPSERIIFTELLTKKKGRIEDVKLYNFKGNLYSLLITFAVSAIVMIILTAVTGGFSILSEIILFMIIPLISIIIGYLINIIVGKIIIDKIYCK